MQILFTVTATVLRVLHGGGPGHLGSSRSVGVGYALSPGRANNPCIVSSNRHMLLLTSAMNESTGRHDSVLQRC